MTSRFVLAAALLLITAATFYFPGHTYLQSDTQIYMPMLERAHGGADVLANDLIATQSHTGLTLYDETAVFLRRLTDAQFASLLFAQQIVFRGLGVWGLYLIATGLRLSPYRAVFVARHHDRAHVRAESRLRRHLIVSA